MKYGVKNIQTAGYNGARKYGMSISTWKKSLNQDLPVFGIVRSLELCPPQHNPLPKTKSQITST